MDAIHHSVVNSPAIVQTIRLKSREVFFDRVETGVRVEGQSFYTRREGFDKMRYRFLQTKSDKMDSCERSFSTDNGRTWSAAEPIIVVERTKEGVLRKGRKADWVDPVNGLLLRMGGRGLTPTDNPLEGLTRGQLWYAVSTNGGHSYEVEEQVIQKGPYTPEHPLEGVWHGRCGVSYGDRTGRPIRTRRGHILQPLQITTVDANGNPSNPGGGYTYTEAVVLIGKWIEGNHIEWVLSQHVANDPKLSNRGALEPTVAELPDGRILMVMRGNNNQTQKGYKWFSLSADGGFTWSPIKPWTCTDGGNFFSPSSCSQLVPHSNGNIYWLGNILPENPLLGNLPRRPFVAGRVDSASGLLVRESVVVIDDRQPGDDEGLMLSNFMAHEDRETGEILLHMSRISSKSGFTSPAYLYRIAVGPDRKQP